MATIPPPYSSGPSWTDARRAEKQAYRAQRDAWRAQRQYWRYMRPPSIVRPLVWIAIGVVALLLTTGKLSGAVFWDWYVRWWPLLLIGVGVLMLAEWGLNRGNPYGARASGGGVIGMLVLIALLGWAAHGLQRAGVADWDWNDAEGWGFHPFGQEHDADRQLDEAVAPDAVLRIQNPRGDIVITPSDDGRLHVSAHNVVYSNNDRAAEAALQALEPQFQVNGREATLSTAPRGRASADLTLQAPPGVSVEIDGGHGDISVQGVRGPVRVQSGHGDVKLADLPNAATVQMNKGDLSARNLGGELTVNGRMDDVTVTGVRARVQMNGDFFGDVSLSDITAPVSLHSSRTTFAVERVEGAVSLDSGDLHASRSAAPMRIATRAKNIALTDLFGGPVNVDDSDGDITLNAGGSAGDTLLHDGNGDIEVTLPENGAFQVDATAANGDLSSDWSLPQGSDHRFSGRLGEGSGRIVTLRLLTDHGDIRIKKGPAIPVGAPPANARHLKLPEGSTAQMSEE